jgi:hypothetical protein
MGFRLVHNPGEHHGLPRLELDLLGKRPPERGVEIVADTLAVLERAVFEPDLSSGRGDLFVRGEILLGDREYKSIDVAGHISILLSDLRRRLAL